ncbi:MAG: chemotaxis protein CheW [Planctomycetia bacterium]|nr:chemotaxis protein CheW [Planctomycetia bacterium]
MTDDANLPPFPFDDLPPLADAPIGQDALPSWLSPGGSEDKGETSMPSMPYWPNFGSEADPARSRLDDTLSNCPRPSDELPPLPPLPDQSVPTERIHTSRSKRKPAQPVDLPLPPPYSAGLSQLSPFLPPKAALRSMAEPATPAQTPPPAQPLEMPPASAIWRIRRIVVTPSLEDGESIAVFRTVIRDEAGRGYVNTKVSFELPPGIKQVQASRKPVARKGALHWALGALGPTDSVALSVKIPVHLLGGAEAAAAPRSYEVAYQPLPGALLDVDRKSPSTVPIGEPFSVLFTVTNSGELPSNDVTVRVLDRTSGGRPVMMKLPPIAPGESRVATLELASRVEGTHQWLALVESSGSEPFESLFSTEVVRATLAVEVRHESTIRVDAVGTVGLAIQNRSPVVARDVAVHLAVPEELLFDSSSDGRFDRAANQISWSIDEIPPDEVRIVEARLKGFSPGFVGLHARAESSSGAISSASSNVFVEVDARANSSSLDKLLAAIASDMPDDADEPRERLSESGARHLVFDLAGSHYAVAIDHVREVLRPGRITPIPGAPDWMPGVANIRGDIVTLVDLPRFFGFPTGDDPMRGMLVAQSEDGRLVTGLLVNDIVGIRRLSDGGILDQDRFPDNPILPFMESLGEFDRRLVPIVRMERLLCETETAAAIVA